MTPGAPLQATYLLNASGDRLAFVFPVPKAGTLDWVEFRLSAVTNNPDNGLRVSFQTIDTGTSDPDGTQDQFRDLTGALSAGWQVPAGPLTDDGTNGGVKRTVTAGEMLGCVIDFVSFVAGDSVTVAGGLSGVQALGNAYTDDGSAGSYTKSGNYPALALKYADGTYACFDLPIWPLNTINSRTFNSGSTPDERGLHFTLPVTGACSGGWVRIDVDAAADLVLYDSGNTVLASATITPARVTNSGLSTLVYWDPVTLSANQSYRLVVKPTSVSSVSLYDVDLSTAALQAGIPGGATWYSTSRTDGGAWTDTDTNRPWMGILLSQFDDGAGGGAGLSWAPLSIVAAAGASLVRAIASGSASGRG